MYDDSYVLAPRDLLIKDLLALRHGSKYHNVVIIAGQGKIEVPGFQ